MPIRYHKSALPAVSYTHLLHPERNKRITERALGTRYGKEHLEQVFLQKDPLAIIFVKSHLRLVVDLQTNIKAMQNSAYANKVKITNLKQMANTIIYLQKHDIQVSPSTLYYIKQIFRSIILRIK